MSYCYYPKASQPPKTIRSKKKKGTRRKTHFGSTFFADFPGWIGLAWIVTFDFFRSFSLSVGLDLYSDAGRFHAFLPNTSRRKLGTSQTPYNSDDNNNGDQRF